MTMRKRFPKFIKHYRGELVFQCDHENGTIEVVDDLVNRSLHFGTPEKQSSMSLKVFHQLILTYTQTMMAGLLLTESPKKVLNLGLGAGSIPQFIHHHYPNCMIDVVEIYEQVVHISHKYFFLPQDHRINIYLNDARDFVSQINDNRYDMIFVDIYDQNGMSDSAKSKSFIQDCKDSLNMGGVLIMNLWSEPKKEIKKVVKNIFKSFDNRVLLLPVSERSNKIVFGLNQPEIVFSESALLQKARVLDRKLKIDLIRKLNRLIEANPKMMKNKQTHN